MVPKTQSLFPAILVMISLIWVQIWSKYHRYFLDICLVGTNISIYGSISWSISMVPPSDVGHFGYQTSHATWEVPDVFSCRFGTSQVWRLHCLHVHAFSKLTSSKDNKYASQLQVASGSCSCTVSMFNSPSIPWICPGTCGLLTAKQKILNLCVCVCVIVFHIPVWIMICQPEKNTIFRLPIPSCKLT